MSAEKDTGLAPRWARGWRVTPAGGVPLVSTRLERRDRLDAWKWRWGIGRMHAAIAPGLYGVGEPDPQSPVLVTANYKLTFDRLRRELDGLSAWILVLDTRGINVWCAAGKGTFGTEELLARLHSTALERVVRHRRLVVPQLGASGVAAHEVARRSAFRVVYGPVRAADIRAFVASGYRAAPAMRRVGFPLRERLALAPLELAQAGKWLCWILLALLLGDVARGRGLSLRFLAAGLPFAAAIVVGTVLVPALLPWIPGRSLAWKGWASAALLTAVWLAAAALPVSSALAYLLLLPPISSFLALNFTGSTTYTSLSGVLKETRIALPLLGASFLAGLVLSFVRF
jgi:hypothetical protein